MLVTQFLSVYQVTRPKNPSNGRYQYALFWPPKHLDIFPMLVLISCLLIAWLFYFVVSDAMHGGLVDFVSIYTKLCQLGKAPTIIDMADLQKNPEVSEFLLLNWNIL